MATKTINTILQLRDKFSPTAKKVSQSTKDTQRQVKLLTNNVEKFKSKAVSGFGSVAKQAVGLTAAFTGISTVLSGLSSGLDFMKDYQNSLVDLDTKAGIYGEELAGVKEDLKDLYVQNIGEGWDDLTSSLVTVRQITGESGEELKEMTRQAVIFKDTFGYETEESIKTVDTMMKQFGITSEQAYNLLASGERMGLNKSGDMLDTINEYSVQFKAMGYSAEKMFDTLYAGLGSGGFSLDYIGDAMKEANIRLKDDSKTTNMALDLIGLNFAEIGSDMAKGGDAAQKALAKVFKALQDIEDPQERNSRAVDLFGTKFEDLENDVIMSMGNVQSVFNSTNGALEQIADVKYNTLGSAIEGIGRAFEVGVLAKLSDKILPKMNEFGKWINDNMPAIQNEIDYAFKVGEEAVNKFKDALGWAKDNASWLIPVITGLTTAIAAQKVINTVVGMYKKWTTVTKGLTIAQVALKAITAASPFGLIALAIGALIGIGIALWKNWDTIKQKASELGAWCGQVWSSLSEKTSETLSSLGSSFATGFSNIKSNVTETWTSIENWLSSFPLGQTMLETFGSTIESLKTIFSNVIDFVTNVFSGNWSAAWQNIIAIFKAQFDLIIGYAKAPINAVIDMVNGLIGKINGISVNVPDWVPGLGGKSFGVNIPTIPKFATGTSYFKGGLAQTDERGGEIKEYPNGTRIIPHDLSKRMIDGSGSGVSVQVTIQGNVIGNEAYANELASHIIKRIQLAMGNV